ncbi:hypothetical protein SAMN05216267_102190 [Actinacidiphila rubida]|uniref:Uncharacterized protein n=1 Tax=Actinacidiphila rubida TaxID=310780 RepID=A0A1H8N972_9ACTN|nr:hypothetical protein [Actinacidiphila rubida]SEO26150.1 hypothetical protein SAMN05216267_102190 [Actinacidiphila rubida]
MIPVEEAANAYVLDAAAFAEAGGSRVWWAPWGPQPSGDDEGDHVYRYFMALDDDAWSFEFALRYRGRPSDTVPVGFWDFTLFIEGGKGHISDLRSSLPPSMRVAEPAYAEDGRALRFVRWLDARPGDGIDTAAVGGTHVRCPLDETLVELDDSRQECPCGQLSRDDDGRLIPLETRTFLSVHTAGADGTPPTAQDTVPAAAGPLRLVRWLIPGPGERIDVTSAGGTHARCLYDETLVEVDAPAQECPCGRLSRDAGGRLRLLKAEEICAVYSRDA